MWRAVILEAILVAGAILLALGVPSCIDDLTTARYDASMRRHTGQPPTPPRKETP